MVHGPGRNCSTYGAALWDSDQRQFDVKRSNSTGVSEHARTLAREKRLNKRGDQLWQVYVATIN